MFGPEFIFVLIAGLITVLAPCSIATLPVFLSYLDCESVNKTEADKARFRLNLSLFLIGFSATFFAVGYAISYLFSLLSAVHQIAYVIDGIILTLFGLIIVFGDRVPFLHKFLHFHVKTPEANGVNKKWYVPLFSGAVMAFSWAPCVGPILAAVILVIAPVQPSWLGGLYLLVYALAINIPLIFFALGWDKLVDFMQKNRRIRAIIYQFFGVVMIVIGLLITFGYADRLFHFVVDKAGIEVPESWGHEDHEGENGEHEGEEGEEKENK